MKPYLVRPIDIANEGIGDWRLFRCKSGGTDPARNAGKKILVVPLHSFGSKSTICRFGERFRDGRYSLVSFLFAVLLLTVAPVPSHGKSGVGDTCLSCPMVSAPLDWSDVDAQSFGKFPHWEEIPEPALERKSLNTDRQVAEERAWRWTESVLLAVDRDDIAQTAPASWRSAEDVTSGLLR